jgi:hypothetical protein
MSEPKQHNAEEAVASAISVPMNLILGVIDLLISKGVISRHEMASLLRHLMEHSQVHDENEKMVRMTLESLLARFENTAGG